MGAQRHSITPSVTLDWGMSSKQHSAAASPARTSPITPVIALAGICLLSIYHRWALAIKGITPRGDCASISTIKPDSGAVSSALHRHPVSNGYPRASRCPFLSTVQPGDAHWLTQTERHRHTLTYSNRNPSSSHLEFYTGGQCSKEEFWIMTHYMMNWLLHCSVSFIPCLPGSHTDIMSSPEIYH